MLKDMNEKEEEQRNDWAILYDQIKGVMGRFGAEDYFGKGDYLLVDDNIGHKWHTIEIHRLSMLQPAVVKSLQTLLRDFPDWEVVIAVDIPGTEGFWPPMGLTIRLDEIVDGLQRPFFPKGVSKSPV